MFRSQKSLTQIVVASVLGGLSLLTLEEVNKKEKTESSNSWVHNQPQIVVQIPYLCVNDTPQAMALASLEDSEGKTLFSCDQDHDQIKAFQQYRGELEYAKELASMKDLHGKPFFSGYDIIAFKSVGGTIDYAKKFVVATNGEGYPFSGSQLAQLYALDLNFQEATTFVDTAKPNALFEYPVYDGDLFEKNYGAFRVQYAISFFKTMQEKYDLKIVVAYQESMLYDALDAQTYELVMLAGHGTDKNLTFNKKWLPSVASSSEQDEILFLDTTDTELGKHFRQLAPTAVIFLNSCSTAAGGEKADNLANKIADWAPGRQIIAAEDVLWTYRVVANPNSLYPFDITLLDEKGLRDITYRTIHR